MSEQERTGWRDQWISEHHRSFGHDCPCVDIDFLVVEYDGGMPRALVEYKHYRAEWPPKSDASYLAIVRLANAAGLPFFVVRYWRPGEHSVLGSPWYHVFPVNAYALDILDPGGVELQDSVYREFLFHLRGRDSQGRVLPSSL